jgi:F-type H+-transporting ATPase subunit delta
MSNRTSAARYARALFDVSLKEADVVKVRADLDAVAAAVAESHDLTRVIDSQGVPDAARRQIMMAVGERLGVSAPVSKLLGLLADRRRLDLLSDLAAVYAERLREHQNVLQADVTTAAPLSPEATEALSASLASATGKQISMRVSVDPSLLGGVVARVGSTVYDGSVRTQLKKMRDQLVAQG